jgi:hypothetical protein
MNNKRPLTLRPAPNAPFEGHYFVYAGRRRVGRIYRRRGWRPEAWFWGLSGDLVKDGPPRVTSTREDALAAFKQAWEAHSSGDARLSRDLVRPGLRANEGADY